jgi:hypothetical protein
LPVIDPIKDVETSVEIFSRFGNPFSNFTNRLKEINFQYILFYELERKHIRHHALYSWSPENKKNFETGNINYLK